MPTWKFVNPLGEPAVPLGLSVMKREYASVFLAIYCSVLEDASSLA